MFFEFFVYGVVNYYVMILFYLRKNIMDIRCNVYVYV